MKSLYSPEDQKILRDLLTVEVGHYDCRFSLFKRIFSSSRQGWVTVENGKSCKDFMWTTERDTHWSLTPAFSIGIASDGSLHSFFESALTMHIKWHHVFHGSQDYRGTQEEFERAMARVRWLHHRLIESRLNTTG